MKKKLLPALALILTLSLIFCLPAAAATAPASEDGVDYISLGLEEFTAILPDISTEQLTKLVPELEEIREDLRDKAKEDQEKYVDAYYVARDKFKAADAELTARSTTSGGSVFSPLAIFSLLSMIGIIVLGVWKGWSIGVLAVAISFVLSLAGGISLSATLRTFDGVMAARIIFATTCFAAMNKSGAATLLIKKFLRVVGPKIIPVMPWLFFAIAFAECIIGSGSVGYFAMMSTGCMVGVQLGLYPLLIPFMIMIPAVMANIHPIVVVGQIATGLLEESGLGEYAYAAYFTQLVVGFLFCLILYIIFKGYKVNKDMEINFDEVLPKFNRNQIITLIGTALSITVLVTLGYEIAMLGAFVVAIYFALGIYDVKSFTAAVPVNMMLTIPGMTMMIGLVTKLGGIDVLMALVTPLVNKWTLVAVIVFLSAFVSWLSSTTTVVLPTFIPLLPKLVASVGGNINYGALLGALYASSHFASLNPFDGRGSAAQVYLAPVIGDEECKKLILPQIVITLCLIGALMIMSFTGLFNVIASIFM